MSRGERVRGRSSSEFFFQPSQHAIMQPDDDDAEAGWFLIESSDATCILPSVLLEPAGAGAGWGASLMQRAKARLYMSVSRTPKELPASAFAGDAPLWLLGESCDAQRFRERAAQLLWFSYRQGFRPIEPTQLTSDTGYAGEGWWCGGWWLWEG